MATTFLEYDQTSPTSFRSSTKLEWTAQSMKQTAWLKRALRYSLVINIALLVTSIAMLIVIVQKVVGGNASSSSQSTLQPVSLDIGSTECFYIDESTSGALIGTLCAESPSGDSLKLRLNGLDDASTVNTSRIWIGKDMASLPLTSNGDPDVERFPFKDSLTFEQSLISLGFDSTSSNCKSVDLYVMAYVLVCGVDKCVSGYAGSITGQVAVTKQVGIAMRIPCPNSSQQSLQAASEVASAISGETLIVCIRGFISASAGVYPFCDQIAQKYGFTKKLYLNWRDRPDFIAGSENAADANPPYDNGDGYLGGLEPPATDAHAKLVKSILNGAKPDLYIVVGHSYGGASAYFLATEAVALRNAPKPDMIFLIDPVFNAAADSKKQQYFSTVAPGNLFSVSWYQRNGAWIKSSCASSPDEIQGMCVGGLADVNPCGSALNAIGVCDVRVNWASTASCTAVPCQGTDCKFFTQGSTQNCDKCGLWGCRFPKPGKSLANHPDIDKDPCIWSTIDNYVGQFFPCKTSGTVCPSRPACPTHVA